jgi:hypothetical protein
MKKLGNYTVVKSQLLNLLRKHAAEEIVAAQIWTGPVQIVEASGACYSCYPSLWEAMLAVGDSWEFDEPMLVGLEALPSDCRECPHKPGGQR